jgi:DNA-directed RNA polymerase specialized sigma24 family protein
MIIEHTYLCQIKLNRPESEEKMLGSPAVERTAARTPTLDLRRAFRRDLAQTLVERAAHLPEPDRYLIEGVFRDGRSIADLAAMWKDRPELGYTPRSLRRRLHRLVERLNSHRFMLVAEHRACWTPTRRRVATACVLHGLSLREAAETLGTSLHTVRRHFDAITTIADAMRGGVVS